MRNHSNLQVRVLPRFTLMRNFTPKSSELFHVQTLILVFYPSKRCYVVVQNSVVVRNNTLKVIRYPWILQ